MQGERFFDAPCEDIAKYTDIWYNIIALRSVYQL